MSKKIVVHVPHASVVIPEEYRGDFRAEVLERELLVMTDRYCDELFLGGGELVALPVSRLVCDVERFREDRDEPMSRIGMGLYYTHDSEGKPFRTYSAEKRQEIVGRYYDPHHRKLTETVAKKLQEQGSCLIIDGHSFAAQALPYELDKSERPDICLGADRFHMPVSLMKWAVAYFKAYGLNVKINSPFAGSIVPIKYYGQDKRVSSLMIEINRGLYMLPDGRKSKGFAETAELIQGFYKMLTEKGF